MSFLSPYKHDFKANLTLALPIITGQVGSILVNIADNIMVGRLGAAELAAVSLANAVFISFLVIGMGLSFALPPLVAEAHGNHNNHFIPSYIKHSLIIHLVFTIFAIICIEVLLPTMNVWGQEKEVIVHAKPYLRISAYSLLPFMIFQTFRTYSDGKSETIPPMIAILLGNAVNILCNYMLIYGKWHAPRLGVTGAALGTFIARVCMMILLFLILYKWKDLWVDIQRMNLMHYSRSIFSKIVKIGVPSSFQGFFEVSAFAAAAIMAGMISKEAQAAHQIAINLASISFLICTGLAMAATIRVGNHFGRNNHSAMWKAGFSAIIQVTFFMALTSILYITFRRVFPAIYINNQEVITIAATLLIAASIFQIPDGIQVTALGSLRGLQDVVVPTFITFAAYWLFALPFGYWLAFKQQTGAIGIWIGLTSGLTISAILMTYRFYRLVKR